MPLAAVGLESVLLRWRAVSAILFVGMGIAFRPVLAYDVVPIVPAHGRPFFMPEEKRREVLDLVATQPWANERKQEMEAAAVNRDGRAAAFLFALEGNPVHAAIAEQWLMGLRGTPKKHRELLDDPSYWRRGQPTNPEIHYRTSPDHYVAFDWVYRGLSPDGRRAIEQGLLDEARFRMKWLDTWRYTPNLEFKPLFMAAFAGLTLQEPASLAFLQGRTERHGSYFSMLDRTLLDGGPWHEATIYPIMHADLLCMARMSWYGRLVTGQDWFSARTETGSSPRGLMDYFLDSSYPPETDTAGNTRIRVATYGDGATNAAGDLFLVDQAVGAVAKKGPARPVHAFHDALIACYRASGDPAYAKFVSMIPGYRPDLLDNPPLPAAESLAFPSAPSRVWPTFGLAMLRSVESPAYWTDPNAIAAFQLMTKAYGHDHADKFAITLHGAGTLLYPDFNMIQYENCALGWTRNTIGHSTLMIDEGDTRPAPCAIRHEFTPEAKFLVTSAEGVFPGVQQTRALVLTERYLLDLFAASSGSPRTCDWLLHSMGRPRPVTDGFDTAVTASPRFWVLENQRGIDTGEPWQLDFFVGDDGAARVRVTMAGEPDTRVVCGTWGPKLIDAVSTEHNRPKQRPELGMLLARRKGVHGTVFAAVHEPHRAAAQLAVRAVTVVAQSDEAVVVRIDGGQFTDYAAVDFQPRGDNAVRTLVDPRDEANWFTFRSHGYLRVLRDGPPVARGGWVGYSVASSADGGRLAFGERGRPESVGDRERPVTVPAVAAYTAPPTLAFDYSSMAEPRYRIRGRDYVAEAMMLNGTMVRLIGPDGRAVLDGEPMFTIAAEGKELLHRDQRHSFTWPQATPASLVAHAQDRVRWRMDFLDDRVKVRLVTDWTYPEQVHFSVPGQYVLPAGGVPKWQRIIAVDAADRESDAEAGEGVTVAAAELALPGLAFGLAFEFDPPRQVDFDGAALRFTLASEATDSWSFGLCPPDGLSKWRKGAEQKQEDKQK